jgi:hypothetical protein
MNYRKENAIAIARQRMAQIQVGGRVALGKVNDALGSPVKSRKVISYTRSHEILGKLNSFWQQRPTSSQGRRSVCEDILYL